MNFKSRKHIVDEETETVYVVVTSWSGAISAPHWTKKYYPGYETKLISPETYEIKTNDRIDREQKRSGTVPSNSNTDTSTPDGEPTES